jgi:hypothetical protein
MALRSTAVIIDVPFSDKRIKQMNFSVDGSDTLVVAFDAALFRDDWTGAIDYRSHTRQASNFLKMLGERVV